MANLKAKRVLGYDWTRCLGATTAVGTVVTATSLYLRQDDSSCPTKKRWPISFDRLKVHAESLQVEAKSTKKKDGTVTKNKAKTKVVHMRFEKFASMVYTNGELVMSPMDFIESVTQSQPRPRIGRRQVSEKDLDSLLRRTPKPKNNYSSHDFFQKLGTEGVITFPEYCFLVACLGKTRSDIAIAYKTFDRDNSSKIEKSEFVQFADVVAGSMVDLGSESVPRSTLTQHFFGKDGRGKLGYEQFLSFIRSLQTEILMVEFTEFSKGLKTISEDEFAGILLRHTKVPREQQELMMQNLIQTGSESFAGITFEEFSEFFYFLNNIDDFAVVIKVISNAGQNLNKAAFARAYKITTHGKEIPPNILDTIFLLFDVNNDGELSKKEFIGQMKDATQRGFRYHKQDFKGWNGFKSCVANEIKMASSN